MWVCVCVGFVMCGCLCGRVFVMCGCVCAFCRVCEFVCVGFVMWECV